MGEGVQIDSLQIEIKSSSTDAARGIDALAASLEKLKKHGSFKTVSTNLNHLSQALNGLPNVHGAANSLRTLANSIEKLKGVGTVASLANSLKKLPEALRSIESINLVSTRAQLQGVADAVYPLTQVKNSGFSSMVNSMAKLKKVTESLDTETLDKFADKIKRLNEIVEPFATKMGTIKTALSGINTQLKQTNVNVEQANAQVNVSVFNISNLLNVFSHLHTALQNIVTFMGNVIDQASQWDGIAARFGRGFGAQAQETYEWIKRLNEEMHINIQQFMQYSSVYATMLTGFGVANEDAAKMALGYMELTYDVWAGYNDIYKSLDEAAEAVRSAIAGEVEPVRRAGFTIVEANLQQTAEKLHMEKEELRKAVNDAVDSGEIEAWRAEGVITELTGRQAELNKIISSVSDSTLEQTAANHGLSFSIENATEAQKSYLRYLTLVDQAHAQGLVGTYAKEMNTAEGLMRTLSQQFKSLTQAFGSLFIPLLVKALPWVQAFVELLSEGVYWLANLLGVEIQKADFSGYEAGAGAIDNITNSAGTATDALDSATKAAKELKNATLGIDELNVISPTSASSGSGSGSGSVGSGGNGLEGFDVDSLWDESIFDTIQSDVDTIKEKMKGWLPVIASVSTALAGLRLVKLLKDIEAITKLGAGVAAVGGAFKGIQEFFKAAKQNAPEVGWFAALLPKLSTWISGIPAALSSLSGALAVAAPYLGIAAAVVGGIVLAFVDYDFTEVGHTVGKKLGEALRATGEFIWDGIKGAFNWVKEVLDIDDIWDVFAVLFIPGEWIRRITPEITEIFNKVSDWLNDKIENLKGNINEFFDGFFDGLFDGLGIDMSWAEKFTEFFDIDYLDVVETIMNPRSIGKHIMTGIGKGIDSNAKTSALKDKLSSMWSTAKTWWDTKKGVLKSYTPSIGSIKDKLSSAWTTAKNWWSKNRSNLSYTPSIGSIKDKLSSAWTSAKNWWSKSKGSMSYTPSIGSIVDKVKSAWNSAKSWWSKNAKLSTKLNISVPKLTVNWGEVSALGKTFKYPKSFSVKFAADGGIFDKGSLIWAGERGPEVMATAAGGKTGVMNVQQMQDAVYEGVFAAMSAAMRGMNGDGGQVIKVYLDGREVTASIEKHQRERGASIMGTEVYAY